MENRCRGKGKDGTGRLKQKAAHPTNERREMKLREEGENT
jgi:hypothetical protein